MTRVHTLQVTFREEQPEVWRRVLIPSHWNLEQMSEAVLIAMGWDAHGYHLYSLDIRKRPKVSFYPDYAFHYDPPEPGMEYAAEQPVSLLTPGNVATLTYDFGDSWHHRLRVLNVTESPTEIGWAVCIDGAGACPPEDSRGVYDEHWSLWRNHKPGSAAFEKGRARLLEAYPEWKAFEAFDPTKFDVGKANQRLRRETAYG